MSYNLVIIAISLIVIAIVISRSHSGFTDMPTPHDKRCYVNNKLLGTPYTFGSGFNGLIYNNEECDKLQGIYKQDSSYPIGKGRCYIHKNNITDDDSYNVVCANSSIPPAVMEDQRCFINKIKMGYDKSDKDNNISRLYNNKECDMLGGNYDKNTNFCYTKDNSKPFSYLCGNRFS